MASTQLMTLQADLKRHKIEKEGLGTRGKKTDENLFKYFAFRYAFQAYRNLGFQHSLPNGRGDKDRVRTLY